MALARAKPALAAALVVLAGCGDDSQEPAPAPAPPPQRPPAAGVVPRAADVEVIRAWSDTLRAGKVDAAARRFAVPALVENGPPLLELDSRGAVRAFNASLPCGAKLLSARRFGSRTVATFRLTERPGGACGTGAGEKAAVAFRVEGGEIAEWRRVQVPEAPPPSGEV